MFPKRGAIALALTAIGLAFLLSFKTPAQTPLTAAGARGLGSTGGVGGGASSGATEGQNGIANGNGSLPGVGSGAGGSASSGGTSRPGSGSSSSGPGASSPSPAGGSTSGGPSSGGSGATASGTFTGSAVSTRYGEVQVQVTLRGGRIVAITALQLPQNDFRSFRISQAAEPLLRNEALQAQSANIDILSGATYTSMGYAQSLQAALDQAGA
jgi:uncharacterized protein with FMN-binding domain